MKIYTDNIDIEMTMEEFEDILSRGMLDIMITIIASLSDRVGAQKLDKDPEDEITSLLNEIVRDSAEGSDDLTGLFDSFYDEDDEDDLELEELEEIDEQNETVDRIYHNIFRNGERYREE